MLRFSAVAVLALVFLLPAANAGDFCHRIVVEVPGVAYVGRDYLLGICHAVGCTVTAWVYLESNGVPGLQRGGSDLFGDSDWCRDSWNPDTFVAVVRR